VKILSVEYALMAVGLAPPMEFLVDIIARGSKAGSHVGSLFWMLYGLGAIFGPPLYRYLADRLGSRRALRLLLVVQTIDVVALALASNLVLVGVLTVVIGSFPPGIVPLMLARVSQTAPAHASETVTSSRATMVFTAAQALSGCAYSAVFNTNGGNHHLLFAIAAAAIAIGLAADFI
jgi:predicted MFS family arabinose efflux permease